MYKIAQTGRAKCIAGSELPHASEKLSETTAEEGHPDDNVGSLNTTGMNVVKGEDQRRGRKGEKTTIKSRHKSDHIAHQDINTQGDSQRARVGKLGAGRGSSGDEGLSVIHFGRSHFCYV
jgi:hypothetical protein